MNELGLKESAGQVAEFPVQNSGISHTPKLGLQRVVDDLKVLGQEAEFPEQ